MPERFTPAEHNEWRHYGHQHLQRYRFALGMIEGRRVLDLACGVGFGSYVMAGAQGREVTGIDLNEEAIVYGRSCYKRPGLRLISADALQWQNNGALFDTVVSFETIEHLPDPVAFVARVAEFLKPGGVFIVSAPNTLQHKLAPDPIPNPYHLSEPDYATLCSWLTPHFTIEAEWEQSTVLPPGLEEIGPLHHEVHSLRGRLWLRLANRVESLLSGASARPPASAKPLRRRPMIGFSDIMPLLPERREDCEVFLFVCRRS